MKGMNQMTDNKTIKLLNFKIHGDNRGGVIALEENKDIPFNIKRIYYIFDTKNNVIRGKHAHKSLEQVLICVHGECKILLDNGTERKTVTLDKPDKGLYISNAIWREMFDFTNGAVLLVLASKLYDESDYIRQYDEFLKFIHKK